VDEGVRGTIDPPSPPGLDVNILRNFLMKKKEGKKIDEARGFTDKNVPRMVETAFMTGLE
jgi:hypothetical protein